MSHYTQPITHIQRQDVEKLILLAIEEDAPEGDITSETIFDRNQFVKAYLKAKTEGIFCGKLISEYLIQIFNVKLDFHIEILSSIEDGEAFQKHQRLMELKGELIGLLRLERILLNFIQYLSGISTLTFQTVQKAKEIDETILILDTRKTIPGFRKLSKYAVYKGQGTNHRIHLSDMAMIKDNHIAKSKNLTEAVSRIRSRNPEIPIEIEVDDTKLLPEALNNTPDVIMLDNFSIEEIQKSMDFIYNYCQQNQLPVPKIEISGGWKAEDLLKLKEKQIKNVGISMGFITHNAKFLDISMEIIDETP